MKALISMNSLVGRLATVAAVLLFSQQANAVGTPAGVTVSNQATVDYSVGTVPQASVTSLAATFVVDNRVDFTIVANPNSPVVPTLISVGDFDVVVEFVVENTGNQTQDYSFLPTNEADGTDVDGFIDSGDMNNLRVIADNNNNGLPDDAEAYIEELAPDTTRSVWILADSDTPVPNQLLDGDIANMLMTATTNDGNTPAALGGVTTDSATPDDPDAEDVVLAVGSVAGVGSASAQNTYQVQSASLTITKIRTLIDDPFNGAVNPFYIPGATVEYAITVVNTSLTTDASAVSVSDVLTNVTLVTDPYGTGEDFEVINNGIAVTPCIADDAGSDTDGCVLDAGTLTVGNVNLAITVTANTTMTIRFQVTID